MPIGTSNGSYYEDNFDMAATPIIQNNDSMNFIADSTTKFAADDAFQQSLTPKDMTNYMNTPLSATQQADYNTKFSPGDSYDYDMQGWYKDNQGADPKSEGVHYPDTYKKPNHPTFSDQSQYSRGDAGSWGKDDSGADTFTPGSQNLKMHGEQGLKDYFQKVEPKAKLLPQDNSGIAKPTLQLNPGKRNTIQRNEALDNPPEDSGS